MIFEPLAFLTTASAVLAYVPKVLKATARRAPVYDINYRKLTDACQTNANSKKSTGIIGNTSTRGSKGAYASGNFASNKAI